jgi:hypothetical protein
MQLKTYLTLAALVSLAVLLYFVHPVAGGAALGLAGFYAWAKGA